MKHLISFIVRRPLVTGVGVAGVLAMLLVIYGSYRWDRARNHLIRIEGVAQQSQQLQTAQATRIAELEKMVQQLVAQVTASGDSSQKTFAQIIATTTQLTAAVNANNTSADERLKQLQATVDQLRAALAVGGMKSLPGVPLPQATPPEPSERKSSLSEVRKLVAATEPRNRALVSVACLVPGSIGVASEPALADLGPAKLRPLPFPFKHYFTVASDADSMTIDAAESIKNTLASDVRLNLSDSAFVDPFYIGAQPGRPILPKANAQLSITDGGPGGLDSFKRLMQAGYVDTIHGWGNLIFLASEKQRIILQATKAGVAEKEETSFVSLHNPPLFLGVAVPTELVFWYTMPYAGQATFSLLNDKSEVVWTATPMLTGRGLPTPITVPLTSVPPEYFKSAKPRVVVSFVGPVDKASLTVENLALSSGLRESVDAMAPVFAKHNIKLPVFTTHTFPPVGLFGLENVLLPDRAAWHARFLGDNPESPSYWIASLDQIGVEYILPANRTSVSGKVWKITELTYPFLFHDGKYRHSFNRIYHTVPGYAPQATSWEVAFGAQVHAALAAADKAGDATGSALYTHWGIPLPKDQFEKVGGKWPLSKPSVDALRELSSRFYGLRDGVAILPSERVWVASLYRTLAYSTARRQSEQHVRYGSADNVVVVGRWNDPVSGRIMPGCDHPLKRLAGITVYVDDSSTARAFVEANEVASFTRNPADESGRQSITFVDNSTPTLVFDEVDLFQLQGKVIPKAARYFMNKAIGYQSKRSIEVVLGPGDGTLKGEIDWQPAVLDASRTDAIQFAYKKSHPTSSVALAIEMANGDTVELHESAFLRRTKGAAVDIGKTLGSDWRLVTIDYAHIDHAAAGKLSAPTGKVKSVRFLVDGAAGDRVFFDRVAFLRQNPLDDPEGGFVVSGRVDFGDLTAAPVRMVMERKGGRVTETQTDINGIYNFDVKVERSEVVMVYAVAGTNQDKFFPELGRLIQVERNMVDLDIRLGKDMRGPDLQASVVKEEKGVSGMVPSVGRIYKPHSQYITSGLSTPPEFRIEHAINNLGYIDRERRSENPSSALRVLLMGVCTTFGHTEEMFHHAAMVLEGLLELRTGRDVEVINMSSALQQSGYSFAYYDKLIRDYKIDVVVLELIGPLEVGMTKPEFASMYHMSEIGHFPQTSYREGPDGKLILEPADASFFLKPLTDPAKKAARDQDFKKNAYVIDGVDFLYLFHRDPVGPFSDKDKSVFPYYSKLLKRIKADFEGAGVKPVFVVNDLFGGAGVPPEVWGNKLARANFDKRMRDYCVEVGAPCVLFTEQMIKRYPDIAQRHWRRDTHYGRVGYRWFAESIADYLIASDFAAKPLPF